jgi:hypothetical protein
MNDNGNIVDLFAEFLKIYKFINRPQIIAAFNSELDDKTKMLVYELSTGENTARDIGQKAGIAHTTVIKYWKQWATKGIVIPAQRKGRFKAAFSLVEYGLSIAGIEAQEGE